MGVEEGGGSKSDKPGVVLIGNRQTVETQNRIVTVGLRNILFKFRTSRKNIPTPLDWLQSLKQFFINVSYHILVASLTLMALY